MPYERIVALYDRAEKAHDAARALESSGFDSREITVSDGELLRDKDVHDSNLWQRLFGRSVSDQESSAFRRIITSGGALLTLRTPDAQVDKAMRILDVHGPVNLRDKSASTQTSPTPPTAPGRINAPEEEVIRLAEEQMTVGKRQIETGKSRIRRFVTEKPVEQQITLHEEHCEVARRDVTDPKLAKDIDWKDIDWKDRTIEVTETSEQPVVTKTARIAEEIVIRRRGSDHVETVRDTVRRQQLEVERVPDVKPDLKKAA